MAQNTSPIYTLTPNVQSDGATAMGPTFTTAAADYTGATATHNKIVWTAGANGGFIARLKFKAIGTNTASVARVFINNGSAATTAANNSFIAEIFIRNHPEVFGSGVNIGIDLVDATNLH